MEFVDLKSQYKKLKTEIDANIQKVLNHGHYLMGPEVAELEQQLAEYVGVKNCITCANGTDALHMVLMAWGIKKATLYLCLLLPLCLRQKLLALPVQRRCLPILI